MFNNENIQDNLNLRTLKKQKVKEVIIKFFRDH